MARPLVIVYQEIAQPQAVPVAPDLNSVIIAPCYVIKDYPEDAAETLLAQTYGLRDQPADGDAQYTPPTTGTDALTLTSYPGNAAGALPDKRSVILTLRFPRIAMGATYPGCGTVYGTGATTFSTTGNENKVTVTGADFVAAGVQAGDAIVLTDAADATIVRVVRSVGEPDSSGNSTDETSLRLTENVPSSGWTVGSAEIRIERVLNTRTFSDASNTFVTFPESNTDKMVLKGGVTLGVTVNGAIVQKPLSYAEVYVSYRALRQDLTEVESITNANRRSSGGIASFTNIGKIDARNPLAVACDIALQNSGAAPIYFYAVASNDANGHAIARDLMSSRRDLYCFGVMTQDTNIVAGYRTEWENLASPSYALENGVPQLFRMVIANIALPEETAVTESSIIGEAQIQTGSGVQQYRTITFAGSGPPDLSEVLPGDTLTIGLTPGTGQWASRRGIHRVSHVNTATELEIEPGTSRWNSSAGDSSGAAEVLIVAPNGTVKFKRVGYANLMEGDNGIHVETLVPTVTGGPFRIALTNTGATVPTVTVVGFDITVGINVGVTTKSAVVAAINADLLAKTIVVASLIATDGAVATAVPPTSLMVGRTYRQSLSAGSDGVRVDLRNATTGVTIEYNNASGVITVGVVGTVITVTYESTVATNTAIAAAINANTDARALVYATIVGSAAVAMGAGLDTLGALGVTQLDVTYSELVVAENDDLYLRLSDTTAQFISQGVRVGDILEVPVNPNDYTPNAFDGRFVAFVVSQIISENQLLVQNLGDDTAAVSRELPHGYARDIPGLLIDNNPAGTPAAAQNYRIRRKLTKDEQILGMIATATSFGSSRTVLTYPDQVQVAGLKDGSLSRATPTVLSAAAAQPGYYIAAQVAGAIAGLPAQHGLTYLGLAGISKLFHSSGYFREEQLAKLSDGGIFVMLQRVAGELPFCMHQLTTDPSTLQSGELSIVKNIDFVSVFLLTTLESFLGRYNVLPETLDDILQSINTVTADLKSRKVARIGPPLISGEVTKLQADPNFADRVAAYFKGTIPAPLNNIDLRVIF
jgi:hypothetical protein